MTSATPRPVSMNEAATLTGLSVSTLRRRREELREHGATQHPNGSWTIPIDTLVSLGMLNHVTPDEDAPGRPETTPDEVADLRVEVERERGLRVAAEREVQAITAHLATAQNTIRMIEAAPPKIERVEVPVIERIEVPKVERIEVRVPERVEVPVPVMPSWAWWVITALLLALAALIAAWTLTPRTDPAAAPTQPPANPVPAVTPAAPPSPAFSTPVPVVIDPPPNG